MNLAQIKERAAICASKLLISGSAFQELEWLRRRKELADSEVTSSEYDWSMRLLFVEPKKNSTRFLQVYK